MEEKVVQEVRSKKKLLGLLISLVALLMIGSAVAYAATGSFVIHKVDQHGDPVKGAGFEVYGKPVLFEGEGTEISITKVWLDGKDEQKLRPDAEKYSGYLHLMADGAELTGVKPEIEVQEDGKTWIITYSNLPKNNEAGSPITYTVVEDAIEHYKADVSSVEASGTVTNTLVEDVIFYKVWDVADCELEGNTYVPVENMKEILSQEKRSAFAKDLKLYRTTAAEEDWEKILDGYYSVEEFSADDAPDVETCYEEYGYVIARQIRSFAACRITYHDLPRYNSDNEKVLYIVSEENGFQNGGFVLTMNDGRTLFFIPQACGNPFDPNNVQGYEPEFIMHCPVTVEGGIVYNVDQPPMPPQPTYPEPK